MIGASILLALAVCVFIASIVLLVIVVAALHVARKAEEDAERFFELAQKQFEYARAVDGEFHVDD